MRMWMVDPKLLCRKHLLGEHVEMHMFAGTLIAGKSLEGYIKNKLVDTDLIRERHDALAAEMLARGMNHKSPLQDFPPYKRIVRTTNVEENLQDLRNRCPECRKRIDSAA